LHAELLGVADVEGVLGVDEGAHAAALLGLGDDVQGQGGLAARLRPVDLDDAAARETADAEGDVEAERPGRHDRDLALDRVLAQAHDRALAELLLDRAEGEIDRLVAIWVADLGGPGTRGRGGGGDGGAIRRGRVFLGHGRSPARRLSRGLRRDHGVRSQPSSEP
jgi:hypothetical protein